MAARSLFQWLGRIFVAGPWTYRRPLLLQRFLSLVQLELESDFGISESHETLSQHGYLCTF